MIKREKHKDYSSAYIPNFNFLYFCQSDSRLQKLPPSSAQAIFTHILVALYVPLHEIIFFKQLVTVCGILWWLDLGLLVLWNNKCLVKENITVLNSDLVPKFCPCFLQLYLKKEFIITFSANIVGLIHNHYINYARIRIFAGPCSCIFFAVF